MRDVVSVKRSDGTRTKERKYFMTMYLHEAFAKFKESHPDVQRCGFSTFCSLRPSNVFVLS